MTQGAYAHIPLIGKDITGQTAESYYAQISALYLCPKLAAAAKKAKAGKKPASDLGFRINDKGTQIITVRNRKPKWATKEEVLLMAEENKIPPRELFILFGKKKIEIKHETGEKKCKR